MIINKRGLLFLLSASTTCSLLPLQAAAAQTASIKELAGPQLVLPHDHHFQAAHRRQRLHGIEPAALRQESKTKTAA